MKLIVGLGNSGKEYAKTRHNLGFMVIDQLGGDSELPACTLNGKFQAELVEGSLGDEKVILVKPQTMMNLSGVAVQKLAAFYKLDPKDVWVIYDDADLEFGKLRIRQGGGSGGHNGINSILEHLGEGFIRIRFGVLNDHPSRRDAASFVLSKFTPEEQKVLPAMIKKTAQYIIEQFEQPIEDTTISLI
jgi:peptidyl-tRNA hydrolase, PTH1 family